MKRTLFASLFGTVAAIALTVGSASAFDNVQAALALHVAPAAGNCTVPGLRSATLHQQTNTLSVPGSGPFYYVYLLACNASDSTKVGGFECGIQYPGTYNPSGDAAGPITVFSWTKCSTFDFQSTGWPAPGGGNVMTWPTALCPSTRSEAGVKYSVIAIGGYFYLGAYAPAQMFVTARPVTGQAGVADCQSRVDFQDGKIPTHLGSAGFGLPGFNPCGAPTPVQSTTWGTIKGLYGN